MHHLKYLWYVLRHKYFVLLGCLSYGILWRGIVHDLSKFSPQEWGPYARYFYITGSDHSAFNRAWLHHQNVNDHHWQYWVLYEDSGAVVPLAMPDKCRKEMLADWRGAGMALGKPDTLAWYRVHRDKMILHEDTRVWVEAQLGYN